MHRFATVKFKPTERHFVLDATSAYSDLPQSRAQAHLNNITFGPPGFLKVVTAISLDPLSIFPSYRTFRIPCLANRVSTRSKTEVPGPIVCQLFDGAWGAGQTLTEADGLIPGRVPRLEQPQQRDHLRTWF